MTICFFIESIIPSIALGSARGLPGADLAGAFGSGGPSLRYVPSVNACVRWADIARYWLGGRGELLEVARRTLDRRSAFL